MEPGKDILIVEDSITQSLRLKTLLEKHEYHISVAYSGEEALNVLAQNLPTLVITDIMMPGMDGFDLCRNIKNNLRMKHIPVILLTSLSTLQDIIHGIESGANAFITKPYEERHLLARIEYMMKNNEIRQGLHQDKETQKIITELEKKESFVEVFFDNKKHKIQPNHLQIIDLLLTTFDSAVQKNLELETKTTELLRVHEELCEKNAELMLLNEQKNQLLGMACHDLRTPLGNILAFSQYLLSHVNTLKPEHLQFLNLIHSSSRFMLQLVDDLLDISKIEIGKLYLNLEKVDLKGLIQKNVQVNQFLAQAKQIELCFSSESEIPLLWLDPLRIEQVLNNLISNAIKYSHPNTTVYIHLQLNEDEVLLTVKDQGQGIPKEEWDKLFLPFGKTSVRATQGEKSTGLGLAIVRKILQEHKGRIWVESEEGKGSIFSVVIPISGSSQNRNLN